MEVSETLKQAWAAVEEADLPEEIHEVAFREAIRLLVPVQIAAPVGATIPGKSSPGHTGTAGSDTTGGEAAVSVSEDQIYERVVAHTGVARDRLEQVVHLDGDVLKVSIPGLKLGKNNAERSRAVAQILTISRGFGLEESETPLEIIRAECDRLRVYDQNNFSSYIRALNGFVITGSGTNRRLRAKSAGIASFPALLDTLLGVGQP